MASSKSNERLIEELTFSDSDITPEKPFIKRKNARTSRRRKYRMDLKDKAETRNRAALGQGLT